MVSCTGFIEPLNLQCILVNAFAGTMEIFIFISLIIIASSAAFFRMMNVTLLIMFALFGLVMARYFNGILFLVVLLGGLMTAVAISRIVKR